MKRYTTFLIVFSLLVCIKNAAAQKPEKVYGKNRALRTNEYYLQQMELWKKELEKDPKNAEAWYNYYRADRNAYIVGEEKDSLRSKGINRFERLQKVVLDMEKQVPESYQYNFVKWLNGNNDLSLFPYLEKAHQLAPEEMEPVISLVYYYEITGDYTKRDENIVTYYNSGQYSPGLLNYGYNQLAGLEKDAIIFTEGDKDTDATFLLQKAKGIRTDVRLLNVNLLLMPAYRERILKELDVPAPEFDPNSSNENFEKFRQSLIEHFAKNKQQRPVYVAATVSLPYTEKIRDRLSITGLAYLYNPSKKDAMATLEKNYEEVYMLDYLRVYLPHDISEGNMHQFNGNYLESLFTLAEHYRLKGNNKRADHWRSLARKVAADAGRSDEFEEFFNKK
ncbi:MAG: hypothetical protein JWO09_276 [Bacteroidetes bacterium]|nr:hypothetical protein [Bacteroidota bacterium]